ncbi:hypothetical protein ACFO1B_12420 [Dactylosporangium siamense]|uniref:Lipoprotein n=1 Tax=Dactylosporangium siamense TaxID=685454 RepID=A0A919PV29_9ACTN|nr:hypothetical protein [Dactylosporangium siamense]GIG49088.1 hypothetical protein Dsi01nite_071290 [Dactylosporangium siamense]
MKRVRPIVVVALLVLTGCGGGQPTARPSSGADHAKLLEAVRCMRDNGFPDYPDPVEAEGTWVIPPPAGDLPAPPACEELFRGAKGPPPRRERTAEEVAQLRKWGACIQTHGIPELPDADSNGDFHPPPALVPITAHPKWQEARTACKELEPSGMNFDK